MDSKRVANQALFRTVNDRISDLNAALADQLDLETGFICECPDFSCTETIAIPIEDYRHIREEATWFVVTPRHVDHELENVVESRDLYVVVSVPEDLLPDADF